MAIFKGAGVAIITPFNEDGSIDYDGLRRLIDFQIDNGTDSIIICGTTGESSAMTHEEHLECIRVAVEQTAGRVPVVAGAGSNWTETAVYLAKEAEELGADGLLVVTPYYNKATQGGLYKHYKMIAEAVNTPVIIYNVPSRTGCNIMPETVAALAKDVENIVGIKEASGNIAQVATLASMTQGILDIYSGNDDQIVPLLSLGGAGVISVLSNVAPRQTHDIVALYHEGKVKESMELQLRSMELVSALFSEVNPIPVKKAVGLMGLPAGPVRMPLTELSDAHTEQLKAAMIAYGLKLA